MSSSHRSTVEVLASQVKSGSVKDREKAIDELAQLLNPRNGNTNLNDLSDKGYHEIFEAIFSFVLHEKSAYYSTKKSTAATKASGQRLSKCATAVRMAVGRGVSKLGRKTLLAVIDHITQVLPGPDSDFVPPLLQDYVKAMAELLSRPAHVELLSRRDGLPWELCVDFFLDITQHLLPDEPHGSAPNGTRASPAPSIGSTRVSRRTDVASQVPKRTMSGDGGPLRDALEGLCHLAHAANAPLVRRYKDITGLALKVLKHRYLSLGTIQTLCFSIANTVFSATQADDLTHANALVKGLVPFMGYWWRAEKVSQDELIRALRNEIARSIYLMHLHMEHLALRADDPDILTDVEELVEPLWIEYSRRGQAFRLELANITFALESLPKNHPQVALFGLRAHDLDGESQWAIVQCIAFLEAILLRSRKRRASKEGHENGEQPRKRRRTHHDLSRVRFKLTDNEVMVQRTALQLLPFLLESNSLGTAEIVEVLGDLLDCARDKNASIASWAFVACASCALHANLRDDHGDLWRQLWKLATRAVSLPATSRAACVFLHTALEVDLVAYHLISDDINSIVTTADVNGPAVLCDTSLALMFHLFHVRNTRLPSTSQNTSSHVIRWMFLKWNPGEPGYASFHSLHVRPVDFVNLARACCGAKPLPASKNRPATGGWLCETWKAQKEVEGFLNYLLLLEPQGAVCGASGCQHVSDTNNFLPATDSNSFFTSKKLVLELLYPKLEDLREVCASWTKKGRDGGTQISLERFQSLLSACLITSWLIPQIGGLNSTQSSSVETLLMSVTSQAIGAALDSVEPMVFSNLTLKILGPCIPDLETSTLSTFQQEHDCLFRLLCELGARLDRRDMQQDYGGNTDSMALDDEFGSHSLSVASQNGQTVASRRTSQVRLSPHAFYLNTMKRLDLLRVFQEHTEQLGLVPQEFVTELLDLSDDEVLSCHELLTELCQSDLIIKSDIALRIIERLGGIVGQLEYQCCEVALTTCMDVIDGLHGVWLHDKQQLREGVGDLYSHFVTNWMRSNIFSPRVQVSMAQMLFTLLKEDSEYGASLGIESCRTSLLFILSTGPMKVKYHISERIADIFDLFILMVHDEIFVDVLSNLPTDPADTAGISLRLLVLCNLACRWSTLLRRCIYHIFETPGKIPDSMDYAARCLQTVSTRLELDSPQDLFHLFSRQLLYTWLEDDAIDNIPFAIFGFAQLTDLLRASQAEAVGLMMMRGQGAASTDLAQRIGANMPDLIKDNFTTVLSYSSIYATQANGSSQNMTEERISQHIGAQAFVEELHAQFVDIVALFMDLIDQEDRVEKVFHRLPRLQYAGKIMDAIKHFAHSPAKLPANQQPMFRAKFVISELERLTHRTEYLSQDLWTPALVVSIARRLLNTVHPALGSLHACSVLRKVRIIICLAGPVALESYCLEMLLNSIRQFLVDSECADDALGICQYLLTEGRQYLQQTPSFVAGFALSTLASLRVFLESSQSSTTQESQFKATMNKAQKFHGWFNSYLESYSSPLFKDGTQKEAFKSITQSAASIRSAGNAEKGTAEGRLLLDILEDQSADSRLLNESSRQLALQLLCGKFTIPLTVLNDIIDTDQAAIHYASAVWRSCEAQNLSDKYLSWSGRVMGRSFSASGELPSGILRESRLKQYRTKTPDLNGSEVGLLRLLQDMTSDPLTETAGLAEAALRSTISKAILQQDEPLVEACQQSLAEPLYLASHWGMYQAPPSEMLPATSSDDGAVWSHDIDSPTWLPRLSSYLSRMMPDSTLLSVLPPILARVKGFASKAFPFIVHLVLYFQLEQQQTVKRSLSAALKGWLRSQKPTAKENLQLLLNTILYLRTQEYPKESSIADRLHWLDIDYSQAASAASWCGMYKTALLFAELVSSESTRSSRRSSSTRETDVHSTLLTIFENIDDPDAYYGLPEDASLSNVLARVEYENEGSKSLAFRGAQYDSHIRHKNPAAEGDGQALVKALSTLGLSGLSHSLLQTQQSLSATPASLESTFGTARRLEIWNLPAPSGSDHHAVTVYQAYQSMHQAADLSIVRSTVHDGFSRTMRSLTRSGHNVTVLRNGLAALAVLSELDDLLNATDPNEMEAIFDRFQARSHWMRSGTYNDVSQILSCRGTTMSMISQHVGLLNKSKISMNSTRQLEIRTKLMASGIYRYHQATQESLNIATALNDLIEPCRDLELYADAAIKVEAANALWDHGEMATSIRMLQAVDRDASLRVQTIPVTRSDLLSKIAHKVSLARLEKPHDIQKNYLEPALKELKGNNNGRDAGLVFHQFAVFCDEQLQDPDGLADLARLQSLRQGKSDEVAGLQSLIESTRDTQLKTKYNHALSKEKQWLDLDEQELRRVEQTRSEFVRLSLENYLLSLIASDEHNNDALRFTALWLEKSNEDGTNKAVGRYLNQVPTRKFASLMNQLTSRLQHQESTFQKLLLELVFTICVDHPYHGMYQIWSATKAKAQQKDGVAMQRLRANEKVAQRLATTKAVAEIWHSVDKVSKYYHAFAMDRNTTKYKSGSKMALKDSSAGHNLASCLVKYRIPPPTMHIDISVTKDYSKVPTTSRLDPTMVIASGVSAPKIITALASNGLKYKQLVKGGHDDLRQDAIMEQVFAAVSSLLKLHRTTQQRNLGIRTYKVLPLTATSGLIEFVPNTIPLHEFLMPAHERYHPKDMKGGQCRKDIFAVQNRAVDVRISTYRRVTEKFHPVMRYFFMEYFVDPDDWFEKRLAYTRSTAAISMLGHVLGLGDRHGHNILLDTKTGEAIHIDLGVAFEAGRILPVPELVPFRLTRDIVDGMGITKTEGVFRRCCEFTLDALREEQYSIMTILDVLRYDPLYTWSMSPLRLAKMQKARRDDEEAVDEADTGVAEARKGKKAAGPSNEASEADRALEVVQKKLSKTLSVTATVNDLINQATDERNLAVLYSGWAAYA
ncbi:hypothetical protein S40293_08118 [Stachybotrys chartarum IBT 40293]|nr:hypothetical protein S40293_08118 [Stachybotrys chartarum IBT 40293]